MENYDVEIVEQKSEGPLDLMIDTITSTGGECDWILQKGKNVGGPCRRKCILDTDRCKYHHDKEQIPKPELESISEDESEDELEVEQVEVDITSELYQSVLSKALLDTNNDLLVKYAKVKSELADMKALFFLNDDKPSVTITITGSKVKIELGSTIINL